jgi:hypothetical protein
MANNPIMACKIIRHVNIKHYYPRELAGAQTILVVRIETCNMLAGWLMNAPPDREHAMLFKRCMAPPVNNILRTNRLRTMTYMGDYSIHEECNNVHVHKSKSYPTTI